MRRGVGKPVGMLCFTAWLQGLDLQWPVRIPHFGQSFCCLIIAQAGKLLSAVSFQETEKNVEFACAVPNVLLSPATVKVQPPAMTSTALIAGITSFGGRNGPKDWL